MATMAVNVRFQPTPNPNAGKFVADRRVVEGKDSRSYFSASQAADDPVATAVFALDGVVNVFMADDFVTVTKRPDIDWSSLRGKVETAIARALA
jgi:hypothetical protein